MIAWRLTCLEVNLCAGPTPAPLADLPWFESVAPLHCHFRLLHETAVCICLLLDTNAAYQGKPTARHQCSASIGFAEVGASHALCGNPESSLVS